MVKVEQDFINRTKRGASLSAYAKVRRDKEDSACLSELKSIEGLVESLFGFSLEDILSHNRKMDLVFARYAVFYVLKGSGNGWSTIGNVLSRDHSTVIYGVNSIIDFIDMYNSGYGSGDDRRNVIKVRLLERFIKKEKLKRWKK